MAKTIVFCVDTEHALRMRNALVNENTDMVKINPNYVVRITGNDDIGFLKSIIVKYSFPLFGSNLVPRPIICLNSVMLAISSSKTINLTVLVSTPVDKSFEVVAITG